MHCDFGSAPRNRALHRVPAQGLGLDARIRREVLVYVRDPFDKDELGLSDAFHVRHLASRDHGVRWEHLVLARHWRETDVLFCPSYTVPLHYRGEARCRDP